MPPSLMRDHSFSRVLAADVVIADAAAAKLTIKDMNGWPISGILCQLVSVRVRVSLPVLAGPAVRV